jgi:hypothetical protein
LNQLESFEQTLIKLSENPRETAGDRFIETEFKYTDEDGMGNGQTH